MSGLWHEAARRLRNRRRSAAVVGAARYISFVFCFLCWNTVQHVLTAHAYLPHGDFTSFPNLWDIFLPACLTAAAIALTPLRMQSAWTLGGISGILDGNDLGFLACSGTLWLWSKALAVRLLSGLLLILSVLPSLLLYTAAKSIWLMVPEAGDSLLYLLTVLHLGMAAAIAAILPLRAAAAETALPYAFMKQPHVSVFRIIRLAFRLSRRQTAGIVLLRLLTAPFLILPFTAVPVLPVLLTAEQLRCERAWRHLQPKRRSVFSDLELHAYRPEAAGI